MIGRIRLVRRAGVAALLLASGCGAILGFEDGVPYDVALASDSGADVAPDAATLDASLDSASEGADAAVDGDAHDATPDRGHDAGDGGAKQAFESYFSYSGRLDANGIPGLGGLAAGDARCMEEAQAVFPGRTFVAWLSTAGTSASSRLVGDGPWYVDDTYLGDVTELTTASLATKLNRAPDGTRFGPSILVWTGTSGAGSASATTCSNWTDATSASSGEAGMSGAAGVAWTENASLLCDSLFHIYCFEK